MIDHSGSVEKLQFKIVEEEIRRSSYGQFVHALQLFSRWRWISEKNSLAHQAMIVGACSSINGDSQGSVWQICILLAAGVNESPESVALSLLNNLAWGMVSSLATTWEPLPARSKRSNAMRENGER